MAEHKAPTEVTLIAHEEQSPLAEFVEKHWMKAAVLAVIGTAVILFVQYKRGQEVEKVDQSWNRLVTAVEESGYGVFSGDAKEMEAVVSELSATGAGPWALFLQANILRGDGDYDGAVAALAKIQQDYPQHPLAVERHLFGDSVTPLPMLEHLRKVYKSEQTWRADNPHLYVNPDPPAGATKVRFQTDQGDIVVALYTDLAPKHSENFLKLVGEGFYTGTKFHRGLYDRLIEGGDPNTKDEETDPQSWGQGGADYTQEREDTGLNPFAGYLAALSKGGETETNGSLFCLTAGNVHYLKNTSVVFGKIVEGLDVVQSISQLPPDASQVRPLTPAVIEAVEVVPGA